METPDERPWTVPITLQDIKQGANEGFYYYGRHISNTATIHNPILRDRHIFLEVEDIFNTNVVTLSDVGHGKIDAVCSCEFGEDEKYCPHSVAALFYVSKNLDDLKNEEDLCMDTVNYAINAISYEKLLDFLRTQLLNDMSLYQKFIKKFNLKDVRMSQNRTTHQKY